MSGYCCSRYCSKELVEVAWLSAAACPFVVVIDLEESAARPDPDLAELAASSLPASGLELGREPWLPLVAG